jgi:pimeloyl-ACP methyl ester carboxylesterase
LPSPCTDATASALLVVVPGAGLTPVAYLDMAQSVQRGSGTAVHVAIVRLPGNVFDLLAADGAVSRVLNAHRAGQLQASASAPVFLAGHSLGGVAVAGLAKRKGAVHGAILLGAYLPDLPMFSSLDNYGKPVLTLAGELDGRSWITRMAREVQAQRQLALRTGEDEAAAQGPVIVLPQVTHQQFADGSDDPEDLPAEISLADAHARIGSAVGDFIDAHSGPISDAAVQRLRAAVETTRDMVAPYLDALRAEQDGTWCARSQRMLAAETLDTRSALRLHVVKGTPHETPFSFSNSRPRAEVDEAGRLSLQSHSHPFLVWDPMDASPDQPESALKLGCKMVSGEKVARLASAPASGERVSCQAINEQAYAWAKSRLPEATVNRLSKRGSPLVFLPDIEKGTGIGWLTSSLAIEPHEDGEASAVRSTSLFVQEGLAGSFGGVHYCMLLSPARAVEWFLVEGLKKP